MPQSESANDGSSTPAGRPLGARPLGGERCEFRVWAPDHESVELHLVTPGKQERRVPLTQEGRGYHAATVESCGDGDRYFFTVSGTDRPDPASRHQPDGVHAASEVVGSDFLWTDEGWMGPDLAGSVVYELHVGTFTDEGTFDSAIGRLEHLQSLGVTMIELLPIAQFPGSRNWGYDGVYPGAAQTTYGGPRGLKRLVDACHARGIAVALDVVYNHLGPEGNYLSQFGPYFTDRYRTPWGLAMNFDGAYSDEVRWFFIHNALQWVDEFHIDALRVDAVHAIVDHTAEPFLQDLTTAVHECARKRGRRIVMIAETDLNDPRVIAPKESFGLGFDTQWDDDFHHSLHTLLTGESDGYYDGYGKVSDLARVLESGYLYAGQFSRYRNRKYGLHPRTSDGTKFVVCAQNHDQIGNRMMGDRLATILSPAQLRLAAVAVALSPFVPMLFMGEEYGEKAPFQYFTSHSDADLIEAVRKGRLEEFDDFEWTGDPPDPHSERTFLDSKLRWASLGQEGHQAILRLYRDLFRLRREHRALRSLDLAAVRTFADDERKILVVERAESLLIALNFSEQRQSLPLPFAARGWKPLLAGDVTLEGSQVILPPHSFGVFGG